MKIIMDELEGLTDNELRLRLLQYGFENIPITETTRKTLIKKLNLFLQKTDTSIQKSKNLVTKYSSDEDTSESHRQKKNSSIQSIRKSNKTKNIYVSPVYINNDSDEDNKITKNRFGNRYRNPTLFRENLPPSLIDDTESTSSCTKRLLQLRRENIQQVKGRLTKSENGKTFEQTKLTRAPSLALPRFYSRAFKKQDNRSSYSQRHALVSMLLMTFPIIFFALLLFAYVTMSSNIENTIHSSRASFKTCDLTENTTPHHPSGGCIEENIESSLKLLKMIASELRQKSRNTSCELSTVLCRKDILKLLNISANEVAKDVHNIKYLIDRNPAWGISYEYMSEGDCFILESNSLFCSVFAKVQKFFTIIGCLAILGTVLYLLRKFYVFIVAMKEKKRAQVGLIIDGIFSLLMTTEEKENSYLTVSYIRSQTVDEKKPFMSSAWNDALAHLEQNEKRLAFGYENINGKDVKVIRLLDNVHQQKNSQIISVGHSVVSYQKPDGNSKKWQGPAFDKCNKITPPTNCLKVRNMFDKYEIQNENLQACIQDTILLKVREKGCKIIDIQLDKKSCCVYVKCLSCADAGLVHNEINGWWLDSRLVVVKFLKEEKYDQRFPNTNGAYLSQTKFYSYPNGGRDTDIEF